MKSFWDYNNLFEPPVPAQYQTSLGEGSTPVYDLAKVLSNEVKDRLGIGEGQVFAKLESKSPTGTHKDRSFAYWVSYLRSRGVKEAVISSSGNSAISAVPYCAAADIRLWVFVSPSLPSEKKDKLFSYAKKTQGKVMIATSLAPKREAFLFSKKTGAYFLRASQDDHALQGYKTIAWELQEQIPDCGAILIPTSSGTTALGIYEGFENYKRQAASDKRMPKFFIVQTAAVHSIAEEFDKSFHSEERSYASSIVDRIAHRKSEILKIIKETHGSGIVVSNHELEFAFASLAKNSTLGDIGWESLMTVAALFKIPNLSKFKSVVCLFTS